MFANNNSEMNMCQSAGFATGFSCRAAKTLLIAGVTLVALVFFCVDHVVAVNDHIIVRLITVVIIDLMVVRIIAGSAISRTRTGEKSVTETIF